MMVCYLEIIIARSSKHGARSMVFITKQLLHLPTESPTVSAANGPTAKLRRSERSESEAVQQPQAVFLELFSQPSLISLFLLGSRIILFYNCQIDARIFCKSQVYCF